MSASSHDCFAGCGQRQRRVKLSLGSNAAMKYAKRSQSWKGLKGAGNFHQRQVGTESEGQAESEAAACDTAAHTESA
ncbi:MAG: hypothetical protein KGL42_08135 [Betaproteobacteria bacterium]|nr:hypothetical protein [Betaproteobacteria bacterium]